MRGADVEQRSVVRRCRWQSACTYSNTVHHQRRRIPVVTSGTLNNVQPIVRNDSNFREDKLYSAGWNNTFKFDPWTFKPRPELLAAEREQSALETYAGLLGSQSIDFPDSR